MYLLLAIDNVCQHDC